MLPREGTQNAAETVYRRGYEDARKFALARRRWFGFGGNERQ